MTTHCKHMQLLYVKSVLISCLLQGEINSTQRLWLWQETNKASFLVNKSIITACPSPWSLLTELTDFSSSEVGWFVGICLLLSVVLFLSQQTAPLNPEPCPSNRNIETQWIRGITILYVCFLLSVYLSLFLQPLFQCFSPCLQNACQNLVSNKLLIYSFMLVHRHKSVL